MSKRWRKRKDTKRKERKREIDRETNEFNHDFFEGRSGNKNERKGEKMDEIERKRMKMIKKQIMIDKKNTLKR